MAVQKGTTRDVMAKKKKNFSTDDIPLSLLNINILKYTRIPHLCT